jgi:hypothetical protein
MNPKPTGLVFNDVPQGRLEFGVLEGKAAAA